MGAEWLQSLALPVAAIGWTLIDFLWQGVLIALAYAALRSVLHSPRLRLWAGNAALLLLAWTPVATFWGHLDAGSGADPATSAALSLSALPLIATGSGPAGALGQHAWLFLVVLAWATGVSALGLRLMREWLRLRRLCAAAEPMDAAWQQRLQTLCVQLQVRCRVRLLQGVDIATPMLVGVLSPVILFPAALVARMPADQLQLILIHEIAHLRRLDPLFNLLHAMLDTLLFYHPAVHWISRKVREDREVCCDEVVVASGGDRIRYARALLALAEQAAPGHASPMLAANGGVLLDRVERIVEIEPAPRHQAQSLLVLALLGLLGLVWWLPTRDLQSIALPIDSAIAPVGIGLTRPVIELVVGDIEARITAPPRPLLPVSEVLQEGRAIRDVSTPAAPAEAPATATATTGFPLAYPPVAKPHVDTVALPAIAHVPERIESTVPPSDLAVVVPQPTHRVVPSYPVPARRSGIEGWVELKYGISDTGEIKGIQIVDSHPRGTFEAAARRALERWRYEAGNAAGLTLMQRFDFVLPDDEFESASGFSDSCRRQTGTRVCRGVFPRADRLSLD